MYYSHGVLRYIYIFDVRVRSDRCNSQFARCHFYRSCTIDSLISPHECQLSRDSYFVRRI